VFRERLEREQSRSKEIGNATGRTKDKAMRPGRIAPESEPLDEPVSFGGWAKGLVCIVPGGAGRRQFTRRRPPRR